MPAKVKLRDYYPCIKTRHETLPFIWIYQFYSNPLHSGVVRKIEADGGLVMYQRTGASHCSTTKKYKKLISVFMNNWPRLFVENDKLNNLRFITFKRTNINRPWMMPSTYKMMRFYWCFRQQSDNFIPIWIKMYTCIRKNTLQFLIGRRRGENLVEILRLA